MVVAQPPKPNVNKVLEIIQSVSSIGGPHNGAESNSGHANPVKPAVSETTVPQPGLSTTTKPVTTGGCPEQPKKTFQRDSCSCLYTVKNFCQG